MATSLRQRLRSLGTWVLDFALPPRCAGCGTIVHEIHSFCVDCWTRIEFLGAGGCACCGLPLQATESDQCAVCLAQPPRIRRTRAAVAYDDLSRGIVLRLKHGRKVAAAKTMARYMAPLLEREGGDPLLVPVPLHRRRLWARGFNQSAIIARELSLRIGIPADAALLMRTKPTPPLRGMGSAERKRTVAGAFKLRPGAAAQGRRIILVDDVLTTGSTSDACAKALLKAGAASVELVSWARVVRPAQLMR